MKKFILFCVIISFACAEDVAPRKAVAVVAGPVVKGIVTMTQKSCKDEIEVHVNITGLTPGLHGFHVHDKGDLSGGCATFAGHFNPDKHTHGAMEDDVRHAGDWGNIIANGDGVALGTFKDTIATLYGKNTILGRGIVVHEKEDDLGKTDHADSKITGNAGGRVACGVIGTAEEGPMDVCGSAKTVGIATICLFFVLVNIFM